RGTCLARAGPVRRWPALQRSTPWCRWCRYSLLPLRQRCFHGIYYPQRGLLLERLHPFFVPATDFAQVGFPRLVDDLHGPLVDAHLVIPSAHACIPMSAP